MKRHTRELLGTKTAVPGSEPSFFLGLSSQERGRRGSVVGSWLLDLTAKALAQSPDLGPYSGHVSDSGEGAQTCGQIFSTVSAQMRNGLWTVGSIANGANATLQIVATVDTLGTKTNSAQVQTFAAPTLAMVPLK